MGGGQNQLLSGITSVLTQESFLADSEPYGKSGLNLELTACKATALILYYHPSVPATSSFKNRIKLILIFTQSLIILQIVGKNQVKMIDKA